MVWLPPLKMKLTALYIFALVPEIALAATQFALSSSTAPTSGDGRLGAVASENKICSKIGVDLLRAGGNAADAVSTYSTLLQPTTER